VGYATIALTALQFISSGIQAQQQQKQAKAQANATIAQGNIDLQNKAQEVARKVATQKVSFLNSGLTLAGTPQNALNSIYNTGMADLNQLGSNYNAQAKNQIQAGRTAAINSLASSFGNFAVGQIGSGSFGSMFGGSPLGNLNQVNNSGFGTSGWGTSVVGYNGGIDPGGVDILSGRANGK